VPVDELPAGPQPSVAEQVSAVNDPAPRKARANAQAPIPSTGLKPRTAAQAAQGAPAPASATSHGGPVCANCGGSLLGCNVAIIEGRKVHKDSCPTGSGPDDPGAVDGENREPEHEPTNTTGLEREPENADAAPAVASAPSDDDEQVYSDRDVAMLAAEVFRPPMTPRHAATRRRPRTGSVTA
jgi:hypothetical protein